MAHPRAGCCDGRGHLLLARCRPLCAAIFFFLAHVARARLGGGNGGDAASNAPRAAKAVAAAPAGAATAPDAAAVGGGGGGLGDGFIGGGGGLGGGGDAASSASSASPAAAARRLATKLEKNLALYRAVALSSTDQFPVPGDDGEDFDYDAGPATRPGLGSKLADGDRGTDFFGGGGCAQTVTEADPWARIDFGREVPLARVDLWTRTDSTKPGLDNVELYVGNVKQTWRENLVCATGITMSRTQQPTMASCLLTGRYLFIVLRKRGQQAAPLSLCEVEVTPKGPLGTLHVLQTAGQMWHLTLDGLALDRGDRIRIVQDTILCGTFGASQMDPVVLDLTSPMGERTSGTGTTETWENIQIQRTGLYKVCWCGNEGGCTEDEDFAYHVATLNINGMMLSIVGTGAAPGAGDTVVAGVGTRSELTPIQEPFGVAVSDHHVFFSERAGHRVRYLDTATGLVYLLCGRSRGSYGDGGPAYAGQLYEPMGIGLSRDQGRLFIADSKNNKIRAVDLNRRPLEEGTLTTVAGSGFKGWSGDGDDALQADLNVPTCVQEDSNGMLWICDQGNNVVRIVSLNLEVRIPGTNQQRKGIILVAAGNGLDGLLGERGDGGPSIETQVGAPSALAISHEYVAEKRRTLPCAVYVCEERTSAVRAIGLDYESYLGTVSPFLGSYVKGSDLQEGVPDGAPKAKLNETFGIATHGGVVYVSDTGNNRLLMMPRVEYLSLGCWRENTESPLIPSIEPTDGAPPNPFLDGIPEIRKDAIRKCAMAALGLGHEVFAVRRMGACGTSAMAFLVYEDEGSSQSCANGRGGSRDNSVYRFARPGGMVEQTGIAYIIGGRSGQPGYAGDLATAWVSQLNKPTGIAIDPLRKDLWLADTGNHRVRLIFNQIGPNKDHNAMCTNGLPCRVTLSGNGLRAGNRLGVIPMDQRCGRPGSKFVEGFPNNPVSEIPSPDFTMKTYDLGVPTVPKAGIFRLCFCILGSEIFGERTACGEPEAFIQDVGEVGLSGPDASTVVTARAGVPFDLLLSGLMLQNADRIKVVGEMETCGMPPVVTNESGDLGGAGESCWADVWRWGDFVLAKSGSSECPCGDPVLSYVECKFAAETYARAFNKPLAQDQLGKRTSSTSKPSGCYLEEDVSFHFNTDLTVLPGAPGLDMVCKVGEHDVTRCREWDSKKLRHEVSLDCCAVPTAAECAGNYVVTLTRHVCGQDSFGQKKHHFLCNPTDPDSCVDRLIPPEFPAVSCQEALDLGMCATKPGFAADFCPRTCGRCQVGVPPSARRLSTPAYTMHVTNQVCDNTVLHVEAGFPNRQACEDSCNDSPCCNYYLWEEGQTAFDESMCFFYAECDSTTPSDGENSVIVMKKDVPLDDVALCTTTSTSTTTSTTSTATTATTTTSTTSTSQTTTTTTTTSNPRQYTTVSFSMRLVNLNYTRLVANQTLLEEFREAVEAVVAEHSGEGVLPEDVFTELSEGSVIVDASVRPTLEVSPDKVLKAIASSTTLGSDVATRLNQLLHTDQLKGDGTDVALGPISATDLTPPVMSCAQICDSGRLSLGNMVTAAGLGTISCLEADLFLATPSGASRCAELRLSWQITCCSTLPEHPPTTPEPSVWDGYAEISSTRALISAHSRYQRPYGRDSWSLWSDLVVSEPGNYRVCWCKGKLHPVTGMAMCHNEEDFIFKAAVLDIQGPIWHTTTMPMTYGGWDLVLKGRGLSARDRIRLVNYEDAKCGVAGASRFSEAVHPKGLPDGMADLVASDFAVWRGVRLRLSNLLRVCWCGLGDSCREDSDFLIEAMLLQPLGPSTRPFQKTVKPATVAVSGVDTLGQPQMWSAAVFDLNVTGDGFLLDGRDRISLITYVEMCGSDNSFVSTPEAQISSAPAPEHSTRTRLEWKQVTIAPGFPEMVVSGGMYKICYCSCPKREDSISEEPCCTTGEHFFVEAGAVFINSTPLQISNLNGPNYVGAEVPKETVRCVKKDGKDIVVTKDTCEGVSRKVKAITIGAIWRGGRNTCRCDLGDGFDACGSDWARMGEGPLPYLGFTANEICDMLGGNLFSSDSSMMRLPRSYFNASVPKDVLRTIRVIARTQSAPPHAGSVGPVEISLYTVSGQLFPMPVTLNNLDLGSLVWDEIAMFLDEPMIPTGIVVQNLGNDAWLCDYIEVTVQGVGNARFQCRGWSIRTDWAPCKHLPCEGWVAEPFARQFTVGSVGYTPVPLEPLWESRFFSRDLCGGCDLGFECVQELMPRGVQRKRQYLSPDTVVPEFSAECRPVCGDGFLAPGEQCDDGNLRSLDGCSGNCQLEHGFSCVLPPDRPSRCYPRLCDLPELPCTDVDWNDGLDAATVVRADGTSPRCAEYAWQGHCSTFGRPNCRKSCGLCAQDVISAYDLESYKEGPSLGYMCSVKVNLTFHAPLNKPHFCFRFSQGTCPASNELESLASFVFSPDKGKVDCSTTRMVYDGHGLDCNQTRFWPGPRGWDGYSSLEECSDQCDMDPTCDGAKFYIHTPQGGSACAPGMAPDRCGARCRLVDECSKPAPINRYPNPHLPDDMYHVSRKVEVTDEAELGGDFICSELQPPRPVWAYERGGIVVVQMDSPTARPKHIRLGELFSCDQLLLPHSVAAVGGNAASCAWVTADTLRVTLGTLAALGRPRVDLEGQLFGDPAVLVFDSKKLQPLGITKDFWWHLQSEPVGVWVRTDGRRAVAPSRTAAMIPVGGSGEGLLPPVRPPVLPDSPIVIVRGPQVLGNCADLELSADTSSGGGGRRWKSARWECRATAPDPMISPGRRDAAYEACRDWIQPLLDAKPWCGPVISQVDLDAMALGIARPCELRVVIPPETWCGLGLVTLRVYLETADGVRSHADWSTDIRYATRMPTVAAVGPTQLEVSPHLPPGGGSRRRTPRLSLSVTTGSDIAYAGRCACNMSAQPASDGSEAEVRVDWYYGEVIGGIPPLPYDLLPLADVDESNLMNVLTWPLVGEILRPMSVWQVVARATFAIYPNNKMVSTVTFALNVGPEEPPLVSLEAPEKVCGCCCALGLDASGSLVRELVDWPPQNGLRRLQGAGDADNTTSTISTAAGLGTTRTTTAGQMLLYRWEGRQLGTAVDDSLNRDVTPDLQSKLASLFPLFTGDYLLITPNWVEVHLRGVKAQKIMLEKPFPPGMYVFTVFARDKAVPDKEASASVTVRITGADETCGPPMVVRTSTSVLSEATTEFKPAAVGDACPEPTETLQGNFVVLVRAPIGQPPSAMRAVLELNYTSEIASKGSIYSTVPRHFLEPGFQYAMRLITIALPLALPPTAEMRQSVEAYKNAVLATNPDSAGRDEDRVVVQEPEPPSGVFLVQTSPFDLHLGPMAGSLTMLQPSNGKGMAMQDVFIFQQLWATDDPPLEYAFYYSAVPESKRAQFRSAVAMGFTDRSAKDRLLALVPGGMVLLSSWSRDPTLSAPMPAGMYVIEGRVRDARGAITSRYLAMESLQSYNEDVLTAPEKLRELQRYVNKSRSAILQVRAANRGAVAVVPVCGAIRDLPDLSTFDFEAMVKWNLATGRPSPMQTATLWDTPIVSRELRQEVILYLQEVLNVLRDIVTTLDDAAIVAIESKDAGNTNNVSSSDNPRRRLQSLQERAFTGATLSHVETLSLAFLVLAESVAPVQEPQLFVGIAELVTMLMRRIRGARANLNLNLQAANNILATLAALLVNTKPVPLHREGKIIVNVSANPQARLSHEIVATVQEIGDALAAFKEINEIFVIQQKVPIKGATATLPGSDTLKLTVLVLKDEDVIADGVSVKPDLQSVERWPYPSVSIKKLGPPGFQAQNWAGDTPTSGLYSNAQCYGAQESFLDRIVVLLVAWPVSPVLYSAGSLVDVATNVTMPYTVQLRSCGKGILVSDLPGKIDLTFRLDAETVRDRRYGYKGSVPYRVSWWEDVPGTLAGSSLDRIRRWTTQGCRTEWRRTEQDMVHATCDRLPAALSGGIFGIELVDRPPYIVEKLPPKNTSLHNVVTYMVIILVMRWVFLIGMAYRADVRFWPSEFDLAKIHFVPAEQKWRERQNRQHGPEPKTCVEKIVHSFVGVLRAVLAAFKTVQGEERFMSLEVRELALMRSGNRNQVYEHYYDADMGGPATQVDDRIKSITDAAAWMQREQQRLILKDKASSRASTKEPAFELTDQPSSPQAEDQTLALQDFGRLPSRNDTQAREVAAVAAAQHLQQELAQDEFVTNVERQRTEEAESRAALKAAIGKQLRDMQERDEIDDEAMKAMRAANWHCFVRVISASGLRGEVQDTSCSVMLEHKPQFCASTQVVRGGSEPCWDEELEILGYKAGDYLSFSVVDDSAEDGPTVIGTASLHGKAFFPKGFEGDLHLNMDDGLEEEAEGPSLAVAIYIEKGVDVVEPPKALEPLPKGWEEVMTSEGPYYHNTMTRQTTWDRPVLLADGRVQIGDEIAIGRPKARKEGKLGSLAASAAAGAPRDWEIRKNTNSRKSTRRSEGTHSAPPPPLVLEDVDEEAACSTMRPAKRTEAFHHAAPPSPRSAASPEVVGPPPAPPPAPHCPPPLLPGSVESPTHFAGMATMDSCAQPHHRGPRRLLTEGTHMMASKGSASSAGDKAEDDLGGDGFKSPEDIRKMEAEKEMNDLRMQVNLAFEAANNSEEVTLPSGWEVYKSEEGPLYYVFARSGLKQWTVPRLPPHWEERLSSDGRIYYLNLWDKTTQWDWPFESDWPKLPGTDKSRSQQTRAEIKAQRQSQLALALPGSAAAEEAPPPMSAGNEDDSAESDSSSIADAVDQFGAQALLNLDPHQELPELPPLRAAAFAPAPPGAPPQQHVGEQQLALAMGPAQDEEEEPRPASPLGKGRKGAKAKTASTAAESGGNSMWGFNPQEENWRVVLHQLEEQKIAHEKRNAFARAFPGIREYVRPHEMFDQVHNWDKQLEEAQMKADNIRRRNMALGHRAELLKAELRCRFPVIQRLQWTKWAVWQIFGNAFERALPTWYIFLNIARPTKCHRALLHLLMASTMLMASTLAGISAAPFSEDVNAGNRTLWAVIGEFFTASWNTVPFIVGAIALGVGKCARWVVLWVFFAYDAGAQPNAGNKETMTMTMVLWHELAEMGKWVCLFGIILTTVGALIVAALMPQPRATVVARTFLVSVIYADIGLPLVTAIFTTIVLCMARGSKTFDGLLTVFPNIMDFVSVGVVHPDFLRWRVERMTTELESMEAIFSAYPVEDKEVLA